MLIVTARNIGSRNKEGEEVADYECKAMINRRTIWSGTVTDHIRNQSWTVLLRKIADKADLEFKVFLDEVWEKDS